MPVSHQNVTSKDLKDERAVNINKIFREHTNELNRLGGLTGPVAILSPIVLGKNGITGASVAMTGDVSGGSVTTDGVVTAGSVASSGAVTASSVTATGAVVAGSITVGTVQILVGSGSPQNVVTAPVGSLFLSTTGGAGVTLFVKETGTGNTGWVGK